MRPGHPRADRIEVHDAAKSYQDSKDLRGKGAKDVPGAKHPTFTFIDSTVSLVGGALITVGHLTDHAKSLAVIDLVAAKL